MVDERIESIKVIRDWKTGKSKGFGFIQFYEPMVATSTMVSINQAKNGGGGGGGGEDKKQRGGGWKIMGRTVRLDQGMRNREEEEKEIQRRKAEKEKKKKERMARAELDEEGKVILGALEGVIVEEMIEGGEGWGRQRGPRSRGVCLVRRAKCLA